MMSQLRCHLIFQFAGPGATSTQLNTQSPDALSDTVTALGALVDQFEATPWLTGAIHVDGRLLEHLESDHRGLSDRLAVLVGAGRLEAVSGGFYSPVLALLLWRDAVGQLEMSAGFWDRRTGIRPKGAWLFEHVWMPRMAEILSDAGVQWTAMEDLALKRAGVTGDINGWYVTEHVGRPVAVLPLDAQLRRGLGRKPVAEVMDNLRRRAEGAAGPLVVTWAGPCSLHLPEQRRWWSAFLQAVEEAPWLALARPNDTVETTRAKGRVYITDAMSASVAAHNQRLCRGAQPAQPTWQSYLAYYGEADRLHKRMIEVSRRFAALERVMRNGGFRAMSQLTRPRRMLYRGQAGTAYGHGQQAGVHLAQVRAEAYHQLITAERACDALVQRSEGGVEVSLRDVFADMSTAVVLRSSALRVVIHPKRGGAVWGLEHIGLGRAFHDVLTRRAEPYHLPGEQAIDGHERALLLDRFVPVGDTTWMTDDAERGDLMGRSYTLLGVEDSATDVTVTLSVDGEVAAGGQTLICGLVKEFKFETQAPVLRCHWSAELSAPLTEELNFAVELNLSTLGIGAEPTIEPTTGRGETFAQLDWSPLPAQLCLEAAEGQWQQVSAPIETVARPMGAIPRRELQGLSVLLTSRLPAGTERFSRSLAMRFMSQESD